MRFREGLINARSHVVFIVALICAMWLANVLEEKLEAPAGGEAAATIGEKAGAAEAWQ